MTCAYSVDATIQGLTAGQVGNESMGFRYSPMGGSSLNGVFMSVNTGVPLVITPAGTVFYGSPKIHITANQNKTAYTEWSFNPDGTWTGTMPVMATQGATSKQGSTMMTAGYNSNGNVSPNPSALSITRLQTSGAAVSLCLTAPPEYGTSTVSGSVTIQVDFVFGYSKTAGADYNYAINNYVWRQLTVPLTFSYTRSAVINAISFSPQSVSYTSALNMDYQAATSLTITGDYPGTLDVSWTATTDRGFTVSSVFINGASVSRDGDAVTFSGTSGVQSTTTPVLINLPGMTQPGTYTTNLNFTVSVP